MDGCTGKRSVDRMVLPRKASGPVLRENMKKKDEKSVPFCSRIACSAKVTSTKGTSIGSTVDKKKVGRPGKEIVGSSSQTPGGFGYLRKPAIGTTGRRQPSSNVDTGSSETSSVHEDHPAALEPILPRLKTKRGAISNVQSQNTVSGEVVGSSSRGSIRSSHQKSVLGTRDTPMGPSVSSSSGSDQTVRGGMSKNGLRNLKCSSVSDVLPTKSSSGTKVSAIKKKNSDGESSSSSQGNKSSMSVIKGRNQSSTQGNGITVSDNRRNRMVPTIRDSSVVSSSGRRSGNSGRPGRLGAVASSASSRQTPQPATTTNPTPSLSSSSSNSHSRPNSSTGWLSSIMPVSPSEADPSSSLVNRDGLSRYNIDGIAEVLLALERIEQDHELTYEELASLETNLFSSGMIRFYDQHSDMRLDIDNMSYEELLALGDEMGTVSTALSEEALSRSVKKSIYQVADETGAISLDQDDDIKCSICQEEYVDGDEVGTMPCEHMYHVSCVEQWLRMKNWCPICKTSAEEEKS
ncbi:RING/U-box superfamily protein [Hirschfeldia incana]|nr:RING/U-box superfamily protein [Hirschfeldia incana]